MNYKKISWKYTLLYPILVFLLSSIPFLFINGVWWDDNTVWNVSPESLYEYLGPSDANEVFQYIYIRAVTNLFPLNRQVFIFHILAFFFQTVSLASIWYILKKITNDKFFTLFTMLLVASFGLDKTTFLIICSHSVIANSLFYVGLALLVKDYYNNSKLLVFVVSILWLLSLCVWRTAALLMPFSILVASGSAIAFYYKSKKSYYRLFKHVIYRYWPILLSIITFLFIYKIFLLQSGPHANYYRPTVLNLIMSPLLAISSAFISIIYYYSSSIGSISLYTDIPFFAFYMLLVLLAFIILYKNCRAPEFDGKRLSMFAFLYMSLSFLLPLSIYGALKMVGFEEYNTRTLCLSALPLGVITITLLLSLNRNLFIWVYSFLFVGSFIYSLNSNMNYGFSVLKQECIVDYLKENKQLENHVILVRDAAYSFNANQSALRNYEYEGLARLSYGSHTKTSIMSYYGGNQHVIKPDCEIEIRQKVFSINMQTKFVVFLNVFLLNNNKKKEDYINSLLEINHKFLN